MEETPTVEEVKKIEYVIFLSGGSAFNAIAGDSIVSDWTAHRVDGRTIVILDSVGNEHNLDPAGIVDIMKVSEQQKEISRQAAKEVNQ